MAGTLFIYIFVLLFCTAATYMLSPSSCIAQRTSYYKKLLIPILIYTLFWGMRYDVGADYLAYKGFYNNTPEDFEFGFKMLLSILNFLGFNYISLFVVTSLVSIVSVYIVAKYEDRRFGCYAIFFFFTTSIVFFFQNGIRQAMALSVFWILVSRIDKYSIVKLVFLAILSYSFHKSAIFPIAVVLIVYLMPRIKINKYVLIALVLLSTFSGSILFDKIAEQMKGLFELMDYSRQADNLEIYEKKVELGSGFGLILKTIVNVVIIYNQDLFFSDKEKTVPYLFYLTFVIGVLIEPIVSSNMLAKRLNLYFYYSQFFVYAYFCVKMAKEKKGICNVQSLFVVVAYFMLFVAAILSNSNYCVPYKLVEL